MNIFCHFSSLSGSGDDYLLSLDIGNYANDVLDSSVILSPRIYQVIGNETMPRCLGFWYYMAGTVATKPYIGALKVRPKTL